WVCPGLLYPWRPARRWAIAARPLDHQQVAATELVSTQARCSSCAIPSLRVRFANRHSVGRFSKPTGLENRPTEHWPPTSQESRAAEHTGFHVRCNDSAAFPTRELPI